MITGILDEPTASNVSLNYRWWQKVLPKLSERSTWIFVVVSLNTITF
jgi:hypothetical protein